MDPLNKKCKQMSISPSSEGLKRTICLENDIDNGNASSSDNDYRNQSIKADMQSNQVVYTPTAGPLFNETRALFIANLASEFNTEVFKDMLMTEAQKRDCTIERAWLNCNRTHCFVLVSDIPGAISIREKLNGKIFSSKDGDDSNIQKEEETVESSHGIYADFIPVRVVDTWVDQEKEAPEDAVWRVTYEEVPSKKQLGTSFKRVIHQMVNYPNDNVGYISLNKLRHTFKKGPTTPTKTNNRISKRRPASNRIGKQLSNINSRKEDVYIPQYDSDVRDSRKKKQIGNGYEARTGYSDTYPSYPEDKIPDSPRNRDSHRKGKRYNNSTRSDTYIPSYDSF